MKVLIFDVDGVLLDTVDYHFRRCLELSKDTFSLKKFLEHHEGNFYEHHGKNIFKNIDWNKYDDLMKDTYPYLTMEDDIVKILRLIREHRPYKMSVVSSGHERYIYENFTNHHISHYFDYIYGKQTSYSKIEKLTKVVKNYLVEPEDCLFVTDTLGDIVEANHVGIPCIAMLGGYHTRATLLKGNPLKIVNSFTELYNNI